ncbi:MAG: hypothetical protein ACP5UN_02940 [Candidatus Micrarchaeia archaeon]
MEKKKLSMVLGSIFVFVIFLSAYAAFSSPNINNFSNQNSTNTKVVKTLMVSGNVNGIIMNYSSEVTIYINNSNYTTKVENVLSDYENKNYISSYIPTSSKNNSFSVLLQNMSAYQLQQTLENITNNNIICNSTAVLSLPSILPLYYGNQQINVLSENITKSLYISPLLAIGKQIQLHINAIITEQGTIYNNQLNISVA